LTTVEGGSDGKCRTQRGQHERPVGFVRPQTIERRLQYLHVVGVDGGGVAEETTGVREGRGHQSFGVADLVGPARRVEQGVAESRIADLALGGAEADGQVE
jgi:hypothetical protein